MKRFSTLNKKFIVYFVLNFIISIPAFVEISLFFPIILGLSFSAAICILNIIIYFLIKPEKLALSKIEIINTIILSLSSFMIVNSMSSKIQFETNSVFSKHIILSGAIAICLYPIFGQINSSIIIKTLKSKSDKLEVLKDYSILSIIAATIVLIYKPLEIFIGNTKEFSFSILDLTYAMLPLLSFFIIILFIISFLPVKAIKIISLIINAAIIGIYVQIMFFNQFISKINGSKYIWKSHTIHSIINLLIWIIIIVSIIILGLRKQIVKKVAFYSSLIIFALLTVSLFFNLFTNSKDSFKRRQFYINPEERFTVGKEENIIVFVMDAVDNSFINILLEESPQYFSDFNDFTLYNNTCSIYDMSETSVLSMLYGYKGDSNNMMDEEITNKLHSSGYRILNYSVYGARYGCTDNYISTKDITDSISVKYNEIQEGLTSLSIYCIIPCMFKGMIDTNKINFAHCVLYSNTKNSISCENKYFFDNLNLEYNKVSNKCFIYEHLDGAHYYCDNYIEETKYCLEIYDEYITQLKELGVYDNSTLIFCADHGIHDGIDPKVFFPTPSTPMLMIKKKGEKHDNMIISNVPVYYTDFQSTLLRASGLFDKETDYEIYGNSIYDYKENEIRKRTWFDTPWNGGNYRKYTYYGDVKNLEKVVKENTYTECMDYTLYKSDYN